MTRQKRVAIITAGHLSTCPRMVKAADAFAGAGYDVRVISTRYMSWGMAADSKLRESRTWRWTEVNGDRTTAPITYLRSGIRMRGARAIARALGPRHVGLLAAASAYSRFNGELTAAALTEPVDLLYGGTSGALAATATAARIAGVPYALDLEDFHTAELEDSSAARLTHELAERIEHDILPGAAFLTSGSEAISSAYVDKYGGVRPIPINNTFELPDDSPDFSTSPGDQLRLVWLSQTVGPARGLEDAVHAMGLSGVPGELHLRGQPVLGYVEALSNLAAHVAPLLKVFHHYPQPDASVIDLCRGYDVGLALEQGHITNRALCLCNKPFTYLLAGLAVAFTDTPGQHCLAKDVGEGAILYEPGDIGTLAAGLRAWATNKPLLEAAKRVAWQAAKRRWHWEHAEERGALLHAAAQVLSG